MKKNDKLSLLAKCLLLYHRINQDTLIKLAITESRKDCQGHGFNCILQKSLKLFKGLLSYLPNNKIKKYIYDEKFVFTSRKSMLTYLQRRNYTKIKYSLLREIMNENSNT